MDKKDYRASALAKFLHSFPHVDLTFQTVNSTFNLASRPYKESLVFWAGVPVVWMLVTLLIIIMYFCYRCCQREVEKSTPCIKWAIGILALLSCSAVGAGFYGNEEANKGLQHFIDAAEDVRETILRTESQMMYLERKINNTFIEGFNELKMIVSEAEASEIDLAPPPPPTTPTPTPTAASSNSTDDGRVIGDSGTAETPPAVFSVGDHVRSWSDSALEAVNKLSDDVEWIKWKANRVSFDILHDYGDQYGFFRWLLMVVILSWMMVLFVLVMFALTKATRCLLVVIGTLSILSLIVCWTASGFHLGVSIALGDFCCKPHVFFEQQMKVGKSGRGRGTIKYYITCNTSVIANPFKRSFQSTYANIESANASFTTAVNSTYKLSAVPKERVTNLVNRVNRGFEDAIQTLMHLNALVECTNLHKEFVDGIDGICYRGLPGLIFLIVSLFLTGLFFTGLVLLVSGSWKSFLGRRDKEMHFLPGMRGTANEQMALKHTASGSAAESMMAPPVYNSEMNHQNTTSNIACLNDASL